jgi:cellulose synthase/poly-beta-1,6-N-acetylglucosamine synthase-like glycosyltransferase
MTWIVAALLAVFTLRRYVYLLASLLPSPPVAGSRRFSVAVLAAFRNEEGSLPRLLEALTALDYPVAQLSFTFVSDGSTDRTVELLHAWADSRANAHVLITADSHGKAAALNLALAAAPASDLVAIYDADTWPSTSHLDALAGAFEDPLVAAASGLLLPVNAASSFVSRYAALETWVYQMVVLAGKERCGANPPVVGSNCIYRRRELEAEGGFPQGSFSEDIELSLAFVRRGRRTRWVRTAESRMLVAASLRQFWRQRSRWTSGLYHSRRHARGVESWLTAAGYLDRLVLIAALWLAYWRRLDPVWIAIYLAAPLATVVVALLRAPNTGARSAYLAVAPVMFVVDVAISLTSTVFHLLGRRVEWRTGQSASTAAAREVDRQSTSERSQPISATLNSPRTK